MPQVDIRWRPSGGRGEYEHVPSDVLMDRRIVIAPPSVPGAFIKTDVWGRQKDGKPRLRRENPNDRLLLNVHSLVAALALFPDPMREDKGQVTLPLADKRYVVSSITCHVEYDGNGDAICTPLRMQVLHDPSVIDLFGRLRSVEALLKRSDLPASVKAAAVSYQNIVSSGTPLAGLRDVADGLRAWVGEAPEIATLLDQPSNEIAPETPQEPESVQYEDLSVDETKRRLVSHYKIDRDRGIIKAKLAHFKGMHGSLFCEACDFSFETRYGEYAKDVIDVHHTRPLGTLLPNTMTKLSDLMLLCSNCHRVIHRRKKPLSPEDLKQLLTDASQEPS